MAALKLDLRNQSPMRLHAAFDCQPGEMVALVGPSGSGKTSLLRAIAGLLKSRDLSGRIVVGDEVWFDSAQSLDQPPQQRRVGLVFQSYALFPHLSAWDNVVIAAPPGHDRAALKDLFARLGLTLLGQRRPAQLSGGQQQRVALARALAREPRVLLLDEPFSALDAPARQALYRELALLRQSLSTPMVLVTHDLSEARRLADRVVLLDQGQILQTGTPAQVFASPRNARVAELIGIQNHFRGRFFKAVPGWARLAWGEADSPGLTLRVLDKNRIDDGALVSWVVAGEGIDVLADGPAAPDDNQLRCVVGELLSLGETSLCGFEPEAAAGERLTLNLSTAQLRTLGAGLGARLRLRIAPEAVHIMPLRGQSARPPAAPDQAT